MEEKNLLNLLIAKIGSKPYKNDTKGKEIPIRTIHDTRILRYNEISLVAT